MARRKTINVEDLKDFANNQLASSVRYERQKESFEGIDAELRKGVMMMLENILMSTDNYKGFRYLALDEVPQGRMPGIRRDRGQEKQFDNTDNTRVRYF